MGLFILPYPMIDPVALEIGFLSIRWYGLAYMVGLISGWIYISKLLSNDARWGGAAPISRVHVDDLLIWVIFGIMVGGRLGYVFFYEPTYFFRHPLEIFAIWNGGMAFHGALLGSVLSCTLFAKRFRVSPLTVLDLCAAAVPIGLFFGRIANFINAEIVGRVSTVPWAMIFPGAGPHPRHPSQLYEAALEGLLLFFILRYFIRHHQALRSPGLIGGIFLLGYGLARIFVENFRDSDPTHVLTISLITAGMVYSLPMVLIGLFLIRQAQKMPPPSRQQAGN